ncbi:MAG: V-type ATP synthase subunit E [Spirochaetales bacterium]|nr:V-type ATP synthase subunit E [Spirochaetales bacterium]
MEVQVKELIDKIKSEGIEAAEKKAKEILSEADKKAQHIISDANKKAESIIENAKAETEKLDTTGKQALSQAGRDLILTIRSEIGAIFDALIAQEVKESLTQGLIKDVIPKIIHAWIEKGSSDISVLLSQKDLKDLETYFATSLADTMKKGVTISGAPGIDTGFRITEKGSSAFYDITDKGIAEALCAYLNPRLAECINQALSKGNQV